MKLAIIASRSLRNVDVATLRQYVTDLADQERTMEPGDIIAGNETMHRQVLELLRAA